MNKHTEKVLAMEAALRHTTEADYRRGYLQRDAQNWPDHTDCHKPHSYKRALVVPPVLRVDSAVARNIRLNHLAWIAGK